MTNNKPRIPAKAYFEIMDHLRYLEKEYEIKIIFAIESGSRAWGFPSPDSDFDVRFVYVRKRDWYLSIDERDRRDVIELPIFGDMDINGWDLKKALGLLIKPNPVLLEWLSSPIRYIWNEEACADLLNLSEDATFGRACTHHYWNLGTSVWKRHMEGQDLTNLKRYFYVIRPAMALRWLRMHPATPPPMNFYDLKEGVDLSVDLSECLDDLLDKKSKTKEMGMAPAIKIIDDFVLNEFAQVPDKLEELSKNKENLTDEANMILRKWINCEW